MFTRTYNVRALMDGSDFVRLEAEAEAGLAAHLNPLGISGYPKSFAAHDIPGNPVCAATMNVSRTGYGDVLEIGIAGDGLAFAELDYGQLKILADRETVIVGGEEKTLRGREHDVLRYLMAHPETVIGDEETMREIWAGDAKPTSVTFHVNSMRRGIGDEDGNFIVTFARAGYKFVPDGETGPPFYLAARAVEDKLVKSLDDLWVYGDLYRFGGGDFVVYPPGREIVVRGETAPLNRSSMDVLHHLLRECGRVVTRGSIHVGVLGLDSAAYENGRRSPADIHLSGIRKAFGLRPGEYIQTIPPVGYMFDPGVEPAVLG